MINNIELQNSSVITNFPESLVKNYMENFFYELESEILKFLKEKVKITSPEEIKKWAELSVIYKNGNFIYIFKWDEEEVFRKELNLK